MTEHAIPPGALISRDHHPDGLVVAGPDAVVLGVNRAAVRCTGIPQERLVGQDVRTVLPLQDTSGRRYWDATDPWGGIATRTGHRERLLLLPGGNELLVTASYVRPERLGPVDRVVLSLRDTESRRRAETDHAGLISTVAHELRSPLTSVKGFSSTLLRRWDRFTDEQKQLMLQTIEADADRVTRLITELLDISRIDAGRLQVRRQPVDLPAAVRGQVERALASGNGEADPEWFVVDVAADLPEVWVDPDRLEQMLANLLENGRRHGRTPVHVRVATDPASSPDEPGVEIVVEDSGEGIPEADIPLVFSKFWRGERRGGTGLGLYVVRGLAEAHGGRISVGRSRLGGAMFRVTLPGGAPEHLA